jgi:hypothetical protein
MRVWQGTCLRTRPAFVPGGYNVDQSLIARYN